MAQPKLARMTLAASILVVLLVLAGYHQEAALAKPQLTFSSSSIQDEVGHLTESKQNKVKTVAGQHQSGFLRRVKKSDSGSRAAKPTEAALLFDGPLKGLVEIPLVKELSSLFLPHLGEVLKSLDEAGKGSAKVAKKTAHNEVQKEIPREEVENRKELGQSLDFGDMLAGAGKAIFGSKPDGSDGLLNEGTLKIPQLLQQLGGALPLPAGNVVSAAGKLIDNVRPLNTINQIGGGLVKGARSAHDQSIDFNRLLEESLANEPKEQAGKLLRALNALLEENVFLGNKKNRQQKLKQQQQQEDIFF